MERGQESGQESRIDEDAAVTSSWCPFRDLLSERIVELGCRNRRLEQDGVSFESNVRLPSTTSQLPQSRSSQSSKNGSIPLDCCFLRQHHGTPMVRVRTISQLYGYNRGPHIRLGSVGIDPSRANPDNDRLWTMPPIRHDLYHRYPYPARDTCGRQKNQQSHDSMETLFQSPLD